MPRFSKRDRVALRLGRISRAEENIGKPGVFACRVQWHQVTGEVVWGALIHIAEDGYSAGVEEFYYLLSVHNFDTKSRTKDSARASSETSENFT